MTWEFTRDDLHGEWFLLPVISYWIPVEGTKVISFAWWNRGVSLVLRKEG